SSSILHPSLSLTSLSSSPLSTPLCPFPCSLRPFLPPRCFFTALLDFPPSRFPPSLLPLISSSLPAFFFYSFLSLSHICIFFFLPHLLLFTFPALSFAAFSPSWPFPLPPYAPSPLTPLFPFLLLCLRSSLPLSFLCSSLFLLTSTPCSFLSPVLQILSTAPLLLSPLLRLSAFLSRPSTSSAPLSSPDCSPSSLAPLTLFPPLSSFYSSSSCSALSSLLSFPHSSLLLSPFVPLSPLYFLCLSSFVLPSSSASSPASLYPTSSFRPSSVAPEPRCLRPGRDMCCTVRHSLTRQARGVQIDVTRFGILAAGSLDVTSAAFITSLLSLALLLSYLLAWSFLYSCASWLHLLSLRLAFLILPPPACSLVSSLLLPLYSPAPCLVLRWSR
ncbi:hypothetical protein C7M84_013615, partial [Penaeus vannamei]